MSESNRDRIKRNIADTLENIVHTNDLIAFSDDPKMKKVLMQKNEQRQQALDSMLREIGDSTPGMQ